MSERKDMPFIVFNCSSLNESLQESELFGHERGAFTGAVAKKTGLFELADGGTLFLDEIGDIGASIQAKILRALQFGEVRRLGSEKVLEVNVRVITATNKNLAQEIKRGNFREDLFYRLNTVIIDTMPLRYRKDDIPVLANFFLDAIGGGQKPSFSKEALSALKEYSWPGNVRELENTVKRAAVLSEHPRIRIEDLPSTIQKTISSESAKGSPGMSLKEIERGHIERILMKCGWNKVQAGKLLGIDYSTLLRKIKRLAIHDPKKQSRKHGKTQ